MEKNSTDTKPVVIGIEDRVINLEDIVYPLLKAVREAGIEVVIDDIEDTEG